MATGSSPTTAKATLSVGHATCVSEDWDTMKLHDFRAPTDNDLTWSIQLEHSISPTAQDGTLYARKLKFKIYFTSRSNRASVPARVYVNIQQTATKEDIEHVINAVPNLKIHTSHFFLTYNAGFSEFDSDCQILGDVLFCNKHYNELIITARVEVSDPTLGVESPTQEANETSIDSSTKSLPACFESLLDSGMFSDVTLKAGGQEVPAHRSILAARSEVFKGMFQKDDSNRSSSRQIPIKDISLRVLMGMLR